MVRGPSLGFLRNAGSANHGERTAVLAISGAPPGVVGAIHEDGFDDTVVAIILA